MTFQNENRRQGGRHEAKKGNRAGVYQPDDGSRVPKLGARREPQIRRREATGYRVPDQAQARTQGLRQRAAPSGAQRPPSGPAVRGRLAVSISAASGFGQTVP